MLGKATSQNRERELDLERMMSDFVEAITFRMQRARQGSSLCFDMKNLKLGSYIQSYSAISGY